MAAEGYKIVDEPTSSPLERLAVNPVWIFLATMLGGAAFGWVWFTVNSLAIGSAHKRREFSLVALGVIVALGFWLVLLPALFQAGFVSATTGPYLKLALTGVQLTLAYLLHLSQQRSFELFSYFGGKPRNALIVVVLVAVARPSLSSALGSWGTILL